MQVISFGFSVDAGNAHVSTADLFRSMRDQNGVEDTTKSTARRFYIDDQSDPDFVLGLVVTVKDQRKFCELVDAQGAFKFKVNNLTGTNKLMEFNFFVINKKNGLGIYQYYHHSCSPGTFGSYLRTRYRALSEESRDQMIANLHAKGQHSRKAETAVRSQHRQGLSFGLLTRNDAIADVLNAYKSIRGFDYEYVNLDPVARVAQPLQGLVTKVKERVSFDSNIDKNVIAAGIAGMLGQVKDRSARVHVVDDDDTPLSVRVANIPENFGEQEYDDIAAALDDLDVNIFSQHAIIQALLHTCKVDQEHIFMAEVEE